MHHNITGILTKRRHRDAYTGRTPCETEGRDQGDKSEPKDHQRLAASHQKLGKRHGPESPSEPAQPSEKTSIMAGFWSPNSETMNV